MRTNLIAPAAVNGTNPLQIGRTLSTSQKTKKVVALQSETNDLRNTHKRSLVENAKAIYSIAKVLPLDSAFDEEYKSKVSELERINTEIGNADYNTVPILLECLKVIRPTEQAILAQEQRKLLSPFACMKESDKSHIKWTYRALIKAGNFIAARDLYKALQTGEIEFGINTVASNREDRELDSGYIVMIPVLIGTFTNWKCQTIKNRRGFVQVWNFKYKR